MGKTGKIIILAASMLVLLFLGIYLNDRNEQTGTDLSEVKLPSAPEAAPSAKINMEILYKEEDWTTNFTHDPSIIKTDDWYYVFSTDYMVGAPPVPGIQIRRSKDLIHWEFVGRVFDQVSEEAWKWTNGTTFWAPNAIEMNNKFYLYYSVSEVGKRNSYIGLATSSSVEGPWKDEGAVFKTREGDDFTANAIDPDIVIDKNGKGWMVYGSYFGGIFIAEIDVATGKLVNPNEEGTLIAQRKNMNFGIEAPEIIYNQDTDYYYLTVSYEWLEDTYNVRVARSRSITGPYTDFNDKVMVDLNDDSFDTGIKVVGAYSFENDSGWLGTGHSGFLKDDGDFYLIHNARAGEDKYWSHLHVRKIVWTDDGWPVVSPERFAGETEQQVKEPQLIGEWEQIILPRYDDMLKGSEKLVLMENGGIEDGSGRSKWEFTNDSSLKLSIYDKGTDPAEYRTYQVKVLPAWDWENWNTTIIFTGMDQEGTVTWGKKRQDEY